MKNSKASPIFGKTLACVLAVALGTGLPVLSVATDASKASHPTIVLVHGAMADASSWSKVTVRLQADGYTVVAAPDELRSVAGDGDEVRALVNSISGPVVLVGHSYGGMVITAAAENTTNVKALVYVAAFAPDAGESASDLLGKFPGSTLPATLAPPISLPAGGHDLYVKQELFAKQFGADLPPEEGKALAAGQRPLKDVAFGEKAHAATWKTHPSYFVYGSKDLCIPPAGSAYMANRAGARESSVVPGASHLVMLSHPDRVIKMIESAATTP